VRDGMVLDVLPDAAELLQDLRRTLRRRRDPRDEPVAGVDAPIPAARDVGGRFAAGDDASDRRRLLALQLLLQPLLGDLGNLAVPGGTVGPEVLLLQQREVLVGGRRGRLVAERPAGRAGARRQKADSGKESTHSLRPGNMEKVPGALLES